MFVKRFLLLLMLIMLVFPVAAQDDESEEGVPLVGSRAGELIYIDAMGEITVLLEDYSGFAWRAPVWFTYEDAPAVAALNTETGVLHVFPVNGESLIVQLVEPVFDAPVTFSADGTQVYYLTEENAVPSETAPLVQRPIYVQDVAPDSEPTAVGMTRYGVGCGGGSSFPMYGVRNQEIGYTANPKVFDLTDFGFIYSSNCVGSGLNLFDVDEEVDYQLVDTLHRATISPDGTAIAGLTDVVDRVNEGSIALRVLDIETDTFNTYQPLMNPDQIAWSSMGDAIFYSTRQLGELFLPELSEVELAQLNELTFDQFADGIPSYEVEVRRYDLATGEDRQITTFDNVWAIGRMFQVGDNLYVSTIPDGSEWLRTLTTAEDVDMNDFEAVQSLAEAAVQPQLSVVFMRNGTVTALGELGRFSPQPGS